MLIKEWKEYSYGGITYRVSNTGEIVGPRGRQLKTRINEDGYEEVSLGMTDVRNGRVKVHRVVATLFVPNPFNKEEVNHIDFNRSNNDYRNLEWVTHKENITYSATTTDSYSNSKKGRLNGRSILSEDDVLAIRDMLCNGVPATHIAKTYSVGDSTIYNIKYNNTWTHVK